MSGRRSRDKGNRAERALVRVLQDHGFAAERVPLSGAARGRFGGDVSVPLLSRDMRVGVKCRADGFRELYRWLDGADLLVVKADRAEALVVLPLKVAAAIAAVTERNKEFPHERESPPDGSGNTGALEGSKHD
jgi:Holliday junction resolvase